MSAFAHSAGRIVRLAWPVFAGQLAVLAFSTVDTLLVARYSAVDLAALGVGAAVYATVFVGFMGAVLAIGPIAGQLYGARRLEDCGRQWHQAVWLALGVAALGCALLLFPQPFLALARPEPAVAERVRRYLAVLALALPASLMFTAYRGFNTAVARPKAVMALQLAGLALKVPLSLLFIRGLGPLPALGLTGCAVATVVVMWAQWLGALAVMHRDAFYAPFGLHRAAWPRPDASALRALLRLGVPMGAGVLVEVTGFTFMAIFIARLGTTPVAGHQIAANTVALMFMLPLALSNATGTLVAQAVGAGRLREARRLGWHGLALGVALGAIVGGGVSLLRESIAHAYTRDAAVIAAALPLLAWAGPFHVGDAAQALASGVLRAWKVATAPVVVYALSLWVLGLGGGWAMTATAGAAGFWAMASLGLLVAALALVGLLALFVRERAGESP